MKYLLILLSLTAYGQTTVKTPTVDSTVAAEYWRNRVQVIQLESALKEKMIAEKAIVEKMVAACGKDHTLTDDNGLKCLEKPKDKPKDETKK